MSSPDKIIVIYGGVGAERDVSLRSGTSISNALKNSYCVEPLRLDSAQLPKSIDPRRVIVFPALHGSFGEDGTLQKAMEDLDIIYCGSDSFASGLCMDKHGTKQVARELGVMTPKGINFSGEKIPPADEFISELGQSLVLKPNNMGSSIGLYFTNHRSELGVTLSQIDEGDWIVEERIEGRELTVGILNGKAMGIVEVTSQTGVYDYSAKYTKGASDYIYPANLDLPISRRIKEAAEQLFSQCGCRDFARIDFILDGANPYFLEINSLPGLTETSLLPKSASCEGYDFNQLAVELVSSAIDRFSMRELGAIN